MKIQINEQDIAQMVTKVVNEIYCSEGESDYADYEDYEDDFENDPYDDFSDDSQNKTTTFNANFSDGVRETIASTSKEDLINACYGMALQSRHPEAFKEIIKQIRQGATPQNIADKYGNKWEGYNLAREIEG